MPTTVPAIDTTSRAAVVAAYTDDYLPTVGVAVGWTGSEASCTPGVTSSAYRDATQLRLNFFRAMCGLNGDVTFDATLDANWQSCALIMDKNNYLNHAPDPADGCYTAGGAAAAADSNLAATTSVEALDLYLDDSGNLTTLGHRRWTLYEVHEIMATGSTSGYSALGIVDIPSGYGTALPYSEATVGGWLSHPDYVKWVAWPPPRYCPYQLLPDGSTYWSITPASANYAVDFTNATVTMTTDNGATPVTATKKTLDPGYGDLTLAWEVAGIDYTPAADIDYEVTIANVGIGTRGQKQTFTYTVSVIIP